jgi:hypothetical protein
VLGVSRKRSALSATAVAILAAAIAAGAQAPAGAGAGPRYYQLHIFRTTWSGQLTYTANGSAHRDFGDKLVDETLSAKTTITWNLRSEKHDPWQVDVGKAKVVYTGNATERIQPTVGDPPDPPTTKTGSCGSSGTVTGTGTRSGEARFTPKRGKTGGTIATLYNSKRIRVEVEDAKTILGLSPTCSGDAADLELPDVLVSPNGGWTKVLTRPGSEIHRKVIVVPLNATLHDARVCQIPGCTGITTMKSTIRIYPKPRQ